MKLKDLGTFHTNSANGQETLCLRIKKLKELGLTPEGLLECEIPDKLIKRKQKKKDKQINVEVETRELPAEEKTVEIKVIKEENK